MQRKALLVNVLDLFGLNNRLQYTAVMAMFLVLVSVSPSYADSIGEPSQGSNPATSLPLVFPFAPNNTPYSMLASVDFSEPTATFTYASEHPDQYAAYWRASNAEATAKGVVVFIHGGCWLSAFDMSHAYAFATGLSQAGYHVWSIEYRRAGNGGEWPVALEDIVLGLQKIEVLRGSDVNLEHISVVGHSAGGHLAAMLAVQLQDVLPASVKKADVIGLAAIIDVATYAGGSNNCQTATPSFMAGMPNQQTSAYYLATPSNFEVRGETLGQFQLFQGNADVIVPESQARHASAKTITLDGVGHFDWIHPGSDAFKQLLKQLEVNAIN